MSITQSPSRQAEVVWGSLGPHSLLDELAEDIEWIEDYIRDCSEEERRAMRACLEARMFS